jgi:hypothetical protein
MATGKTDIKGWVKEEFAPLAKQHGFKIGTYKRMGVFSIYKEADHDSICIWFDVDSYSVGYAFSSRINAVEELLYKFSRDEVFIEGSNTVRIPDGVEKFYYTPATTKEELMAYLAPLKEQFAEVVAQLEFYTNPQHVLDLWLSLKTNEDKNAYFGDAYKFAKMIVVAKLSNSSLLGVIANDSLMLYQKLAQENEAYMQKLEVCKRIIAHYEL